MEASEHAHGTGLVRAGERHRTRLIVAFGVILTFFVVQAVAAVWTNSLALLADAAHMLTDVVGLGMAVAAIQLASRFERRTSAARSHHTFGLYRLEILAAFVNSLLLFGVALWVVIEAVARLGDEPDVLGAPMLVVAVVGLIANLIAFMLLREGATESINVEGAYLEVLADTVSSIGVIVAAVLVQAFGWTWIDSLVGAAIGLWILPRTWRLGRRAVRILLQDAPAHVDLDRLADDLAAIDGVIEVHDLHVWTLTSEMDAVSAHLVTAGGADTHAVLDRARAQLADSYGVAHGTFQIEPGDHRGCDEVGW
jgi:cobalt-zinc-cadmium efflux system protein